jgi:hypothetical protein
MRPPDAGRVYAISRSIIDHKTKELPGHSLITITDRHDEVKARLKQQQTEVWLVGS